MAEDSSETAVQRRLAEMDERLRAIQDELEPDAGVPARPPRRSKRAPRIFPPQPAREERGEPLQPTAPEPRPQPRGAAAEVNTEPLRPTPAPLAPAGSPLEAMCARLLRASQELLAGYELALEHARQAPSGTGAAAITLAAGPFSSLAVLERFQQALGGLPDVEAVALRGFDGGDRAILEVQLGE